MAENKTVSPKVGEPETKTVGINLPAHVHKHFLDAAVEDSRTLKNYLELQIKKLYAARVNSTQSEFK